jgi:hypothetical protein
MSMSMNISIATMVAAFAVVGCSADATTTPDSTETSGSAGNSKEANPASSDVESKAKAETASLIAKQGATSSISTESGPSAADLQKEGVPAPSGEQRCRNYLAGGATCSSCSWGWIGHTNGGVCTFCTDYSDFGCTTW